MFPEPAVMSAKPPLRVLILSARNSGRSQMAEALWQSMGGSRWQVYSAGAIPDSVVNPYVVRVLREAGIDASARRPKPVEQFRGESFDLLVTLNDNILERCNLHPDARCHLDWPIYDPANFRGSDSECLSRFRSVREALRDQIHSFLTDRKPTILFLSVRNSCRSQMAEGILRHFAGDRFEIYSAGTRPTTNDRRAIEIMDEVGIDISCQRAKSIDELIPRVPITVPILICKKNERYCPTVLPRCGNVVHWPFQDPRLAVKRDGVSLSVHERFRRVRDEILSKVQQWLDQLNDKSSPPISPFETASRLSETATAPGIVAIHSTFAS